MVFEFRFPDVGEGITEGRIVEWKIKEGDKVEADQVIAMIETDKAVVEIPSPQAGTITSIPKKVGETINVGDILVSISESGEKVSTAPAKKETKGKAKGKQPKKESTGVVGEIKVGSNVIESSNEGMEGAKPVKEKPVKVKATPKVRKLAKELGVDLSKLTGTGQHGEITEHDIKPSSKEPVKAAAAQVTGSRVSFDKYGRFLEIPLTQVRKTIALKMQKSSSEIPHAVSMIEVDVTKLDAVRKQEKPVAENKGLKLTFLPFIIRAVVVALKKHPFMNASFDLENEKIITKQYYNIGVAVDTAHGLMVPVVKNADSKSMIDIAFWIQKLSDQARNRTISLGDLRGGTFTITNYGSIGGSFGVPIINPPESGILGVGRITEKPVVVKSTGLLSGEKKIEIRKILPLSLSFDHRVVDGAQAARFMVDLKKHLEDPNLLLVDID